MDLSTEYLGLKLKSPLVPSASPLSRNLDCIRRLEDAGAAAVVMFSLFEEQITMESHQLDHYLTYGTESYPEALSYFPDMQQYNIGPEEYLELIRRARESVDIPIIASLNGVSSGGWIRYARLMEQAGAHALELNIYFIPTNPHLSGAQVEEMYLQVLRDVRASVSIPIAVKIGPYFSSLAYMARHLAAQGADGLVLFNRFYQPDFDLENLEVVPHLVLSTSDELRLPLRWVAILYGRISVDFAISSGVHTHLDVIKAMMAGANIAQMASELLHNGLRRIGEIQHAMTRWMEEYEYESVAQMRGSMSQRNVAEPAAFERANYMKVLDSFRPDPTGQLP
ncbi:MAG TPA: dihydroorotate dehydrogenase-like protein [Chthonomonadales bacterium]|nr:dihydroorotate dehydrogenase-like protein [Chthonomonadales bacterium]